MTEKILLLHGPVESIGINYFTSQLYSSAEERKSVNAKFNAAENIRALSHIFRFYGYKIFYSGWNEDRNWIIENSNFFDGYCINSQDEIEATSEFLGSIITNNKEKLYYSIFYGLNCIEKEVGSNCLIVNMRSDVSVKADEVDKSTLILNNYPNSILIEFAKMDNIFFIPDFITVGSFKTQMDLYGNLVRMSENGGSYHVSVHIDLGIELVNMVNQGALNKIVCMNRKIHDSMVWRGLPRYYANYSEDASKNLVFDCLISYPEYYTVESILESIHPELLGRKKNNYFPN